MEYRIVCGDGYENVIKDLLGKCSMPNKKVHKGLKFVLEYKSTPIGCVRVVPSRDQKSVLIASLCVLEEHRGNGSGKYLMEYVHHWCRIAGVKAIYLAAVDKAVDFYRRLQYTDIPLDGKVPYEFIKPMVKIFEEYRDGDYAFKITNYMLLNLEE